MHFFLTRSGEPIPRCDGVYGSDDFGRHGHNETEPCGAFGCNCRYSPGNCGDVRYSYQQWDEIEAMYGVRLETQAAEVAHAELKAAEAKQKAEEEARATEAETILPCKRCPSRSA